MENMLGKSVADSTDIIVEIKKERRINTALMIDTSLSMTGRKLAWAAVSTAVLAKRINLKDIAVISFESTANVLKHIGKAESMERLIERVLNVYATGYTNIEDGLKHKALILTEALALESNGKRDNELAYSIRALVSEGTLKYQYTGFRGKERVTIVKKMEGPTSLLTTTIKGKLEEVGAAIEIK